MTTDAGERREPKGYADDREPETGNADRRVWGNVPAKPERECAPTFA
jgi:hypothetical protein